MIRRAHGEQAFSGKRLLRGRYFKKSVLNMENNPSIPTRNYYIQISTHAVVQTRKRAPLIFALVICVSKLIINT